MPNAQKKNALTEGELRVLKEYWEWDRGYAIISTLFTILFFGGAHFLFDHIGVDDRVRVPAFIMLAMLILVNEVWRVAGALAARIDLVSRGRHPSEGLGIRSQERES